MDKIYKVRIEAYDPETDKREVVLDENEDINGYTGFMFFGKEQVDEEGKGGLRSVVCHLTTVDVANIMLNEEMFASAMKVLMLHKLMEGDKENAT